MKILAALDGPIRVTVPTIAALDPRVTVHAERWTGRATQFPG